MHSEPVVLSEVSVMYVESPTGLAGAADAFERLEASFPSRKGRKFYGTFRPPNGPYRACVAIVPGDDPAALRLPTWTLPAGKYARAKVMNWMEQMPEIGKTFARMSEAFARDPSRPGIEFYRSARELVLFLPIT